MADLELVETPPPATARIPPALTEETGYLLRRAYVRAQEEAQGAMPADFPVRHYEVLQTAADLGPRSQQYIAQLLWINRTIMVKLVDALEDEGLVERRRDPSDRRSYALELTTAGRAALRNLSAAADHAEAAVTQSLSPRERAKLRTFLRKISGAIGPSTELPAGLADRVAFLLGAAHHAVRDRVNESLQALELTTALYGVLATIAGRGPSSQQAIADQLGLTGPAIVQTVDRLQALGLVDRQRDPTDRRSYALEPTPKGQAALGQVRETIASLHQDLDAALGGTHERHELNRLLRAIVETD